MTANILTKPFPRLRFGKQRNSIIILHTDHLEDDLEMSHIWVLTSRIGGVEVVSSTRATRAGLKFVKVGFSYGFTNRSG